MLLCASHLYPDPKSYLGFAMCLIKDYEDIPQRSLIEDCALEHAIEFDKLSDCASQDDGGFGVDMLRKSVGRSAAVGQTAHKSRSGYLTDSTYLGRCYKELHCPSKRGGLLHPRRRRVERLPPRAWG